MQSSFAACVGGSSLGLSDFDHVRFELYSWDAADLLERILCGRIFLLLSLFFLADVFTKKSKQRRDHLSGRVLFALEFVSLGRLFSQTYARTRKTI